MDFELEKYRGQCDCGKEHKLTTGYILLGAGATDKLGETVEALGLTHGGRIVCGSNTKPYADVIADKISLLLCEENPIVTLEASGLHADDEGVELLKSALPDDTKYLIAAGSGTIHDLVRYVVRERQNFTAPFIRD